MSGYTKIVPGGGGEFPLTKQNFGKINDAVYELKHNVATVGSKEYAADITGTSDATAVWNAAISDVSAAGGGIVTAPYGSNFKMLGELLYKADVHIKGAGKRGLRMFWPTDLGAGKHAITYNTGTAGVQSDAASITGVQLAGPGGHSNGVLGCQMGGIKTYSGVDLTEVNAEGFRNGVAINSDHNCFIKCKFSLNYYNVEYADGETGAGNQFFLHCVMDSPYFASVACFGDNIIDGCVFVGGHVGFGPYGFYKADGAITGASQRGLMAETSLINLAFEQCGNGAILDESTGGGSGSDSMFHCYIENPGFTWGYDGNSILSRARDYAVSVRFANGTRIRQGAYPFAGGSGPDHVHLAGLDMAGSDIVIEDSPSPTPNGYPLFSDRSSGANITYRQGSVRAIVKTATATITAGDILEQSGGYDNVRRFGSSGPTGYQGVALNSATSGQAVICAHEGQVDVTCESVGAGQTISPYPTTPHHGHTTPNYDFQAAGLPSEFPIIGICTGAGGGAGGSAAPVDLVGPYPDRFYVRPAPVSSLPTAAAAYRGQLLRVEGGAGVADGLYVCEKDSAGTYAWRQFSRHSGSASVQNGSTIAHGLGATPTKVTLTPSVAKRLVSATTLGSANITISLHDDTGAAIVANETVYWTAEV